MIAFLEVVLVVLLPLGGYAFGLLRVHSMTPVERNEHFLRWQRRLRRVGVKLTKRSHDRRAPPGDE